jgi:hypothetical protein
VRRVRALALALLGAALLAPAVAARADVFGGISLVSDSGVEQATYARNPALSGDARFVAFEGLFEGRTGVWRRNIETGAVEPVAVGEPNTVAGSAELPSISADGRYVSFTTRAPLTPANDRNIGPDVYVRDMDVPESASCEEESLHPATPCPFTLASAVDDSTRGLSYEYTTSEERESQEEDYGALAPGRSGLSANGQEVVFVTTAPSDLDGPATSPLEVAVRHLDTGQTQIVSIEYDPATHGPALNEQGLPQAVKAELAGGGNEVFGAVVSAGKPLPFEAADMYHVTREIPVSISADGSTVAWMGEDIERQAPLLALETRPAGYAEPLWRRIGEGELAPTRRISGGSDPESPECLASGEQTLSSNPESDPCEGPFLAEPAEGLWTNRTFDESDPTPELSADGYKVALLADVQLRALGGAFGLSQVLPSDVYVANMQPGLTRTQALTPLTEFASGSVTDIADDGPIGDLAISPDGSQIAFTAKRTAFPLGVPAYITAPESVPGLLELFDVDLDNDTLTRVTHGYEGGASEHPHRIIGSEEDVYPEPGDGALSPTFSADGNTLAFSSTASNLVFGDGNTPPLGHEEFDGGDVFLVKRIVFASSAAPQSISEVPPNPAVTPDWKLGLTAASLAGGRVRLYAEVPADGALKAVARGVITITTKASKTSAHRAARKRKRTVSLTRAVAAAAQGVKPGADGLVVLTLTVAPAYRSLASRHGGLYATATVTFAAPGHPTLKALVRVHFAIKKATKPAHSKGTSR